MRFHALSRSASVTPSTWSKRAIALRTCFASTKWLLPGVGKSEIAPEELVLVCSAQRRGLGLSFRPGRVLRVLALDSPRLLQVLSGCVLLLRGCHHRLLVLDPRFAARRGVSLGLLPLKTWVLAWLATQRKRIRSAAEVTLEQAATAMGISRARLEQWEDRVSPRACASFTYRQLLAVLAGMS